MENNESVEHETVNDKDKRIKTLKNVLKHSCIILSLIIYCTFAILFTFQNRFIFKKSENFVSSETHSWFTMSFSISISIGTENHINFGTVEHGSDTDLFLFHDRTMNTIALNEMMAGLTRYNIIYYHAKEYEDGTFIKDTKKTLENIRTLVEFMSYRRNKVVVYGQSFGCYLALLSTKIMDKKLTLVLANPFFSFRSVVKHQFFLPLHLLLVNDCNNYKLLKKFNGKMMLILSENDAYLPKNDIKKMRELTESKNGQIFVIEGAGHFDVSKKDQFYTILNNDIAREVE
ncbi:hypothetical protein VCUG_02002 [Vavraia culicis subsp. floridensis]|uniref:Serine hydrolase FSH domain-containing protein n=1 Tax=Vavraia culicis (isolate floridensis) TaxID=948595 RepID=L2GTU0_VAVCU|nr:uncharacterized protein VCUG_02002 [Vavraia culicis subsp. floridensis]ELA46510.1 hypothetical protein VCUG_02002 [Vavraia culicis subsp. floridensis]